MNNRKHYSIFDKEKIVAFIALIAIVIVVTVALTVSLCHGEQLATCWIMCKPGSYVTIREKPNKKSAERGYLDSGDDFQTDGESVDGWIRCYNAGEGGWVYCGYVVTEKPELSGERYVCCAVKQAACRKWIGGPKVDGAGRIKNGQHCIVFCMADGWAVTNRGYIKSEWLEVDPE